MAPRFCDSFFSFLLQHIPTSILFLSFSWLLVVVLFAIIVAFFHNFLFKVLEEVEMRSSSQQFKPVEIFIDAVLNEPFPEPGSPPFHCSLSPPPPFALLFPIALLVFWSSLSFNSELPSCLADNRQSIVVPVCSWRTPGAVDEFTLRRPTGLDSLLDFVRSFFLSFLNVPYSSCD